MTEVILVRSFGKSKDARRGRLTFEPLEARVMLDGSPVISELMAINDDTLQTRIRASVADPWEDPISPDWIEIHNPGAAAMDLAGWQLRDNGDTWTFPAGTSIAPDDYLVVMASDENITDPALDENGYLHTNFKLGGGGEYLALIDPDGTVADAYAPPVSRSDRRHFLRAFARRGNRAGRGGGGGRLPRAPLPTTRRRERPGPSRASTMSPGRVSATSSRC